MDKGLIFIKEGFIVIYVVINFLVFGFIVLFDILCNDFKLMINKFYLINVESILLIGDNF